MSRRYTFEEWAAKTSSMSATEKALAKIVWNAAIEAAYRACYYAPDDCLDDSEEARIATESYHHGRDEAQRAVNGLRVE